MHSPGAKRARTPRSLGPEPLVAVAMFAWGLSACAGKQTGDEGDAREYEPTEIVENTPPQSQPTTSGPGEVPSQTPPESPPPVGGPLDFCTATTWTNPDDQKQEAACTQVWDESGDEPVLRYVCSCDLVECPIYGEPIDDGDPLTTPEVSLNACVLDGVASGCQESLQTVCGVTEGQHGFCERGYYGLTPTRPDQDPPESATVVCFEQPDGTHACNCPVESELMPSPETECNSALLRACQTPCESTAGRCEPGDDGYECNCTAGFERAVDGGLCDYALFYACEPACSNEEGACYWDPSGGSQITCLCNEETEPQVMERDPNVQGDECRTPLVETCGGSAEGPNAWPQ